MNRDLPIRVLFTWAWLTAAGWPGYRDLFRFGFIWEIWARFPRWEKVKDPGNEFWRQIRETKQTWPNTKILSFGPIMIAFVTLKAVSLRLNGILIMWQCKTMLSGPPEFIPPFIPVPGMKCSYGKISSPLTEISGTEPACPRIWTHQSKILQKN